jgi:hypothetical protein
MLDIARVQKLHEAAIAAGLPGVLASGHKLHSFGDDKWSLLRTHTDHDDGKTYGNTVDSGLVAQAAVAWWLREWCIEHRGVDAFGDPEVRTDIEYLEWAEEIVANRKARPWAFR